MAWFIYSSSTHCQFEAGARVLNPTYSIEVSISEYSGTALQLAYVNIYGPLLIPSRYAIIIV